MTNSLKLGQERGLEVLNSMLLLLNRNLPNMGLEEDQGLCNLRNHEVLQDAPQQILEYRRKSSPDTNQLASLKATYTP